MVERLSKRPLSVHRQEARLGRGQTVAEVLRGLGLSGSEAQALVAVSASFVDLRQLPDGTRWAAGLDADRHPTSFELEIDGRGVFSAERASEGWKGSWRAFSRTVERRAIQGEVNGAFEGAVEQAGAPGDLAYAVAEVLQWDLDFNRDLRRGDRFEILFEQILLEGKPYSLGNVLAVRYTNRGRTLEAYRFGSGEYFDAEGRPLQKMFLRSPIPYSRVTSRFSSRRFHPVLKVAMPHYGVDYGAPEGTPARATAAGVVAFVGWDGGGGKTVKIRHPNGFLTGYLHLSRFAAGVTVGSRVAQGEVIGYVGSTGLATGPHLDYRVQQNGRWIDPLSLNRVPADPVPLAKLPEFLAARDAMRVSFAERAATTVGTATLASAGTVPSPAQATGGREPTGRAGSR
ncbi:MAG: peptidoglycan DD-metalloendopeptidase family protein [Holophagales bacterium]|nr:MAG: peptidoglycan DD-metalloendopeptidase family protein [Holophagales bacterium]